MDGLCRNAASHTQLPFPGGPESRGFLEDLSDRHVSGERVAGIILESIPGWTTTPHPAEYIEDLRVWARANRVLLACDEVQSGLGRTGRWFAFEHYGITPDLIACGKGLTGCLPASAVIGPEELMDLAEPGEMSSTFGGNPITAAAVVANLEVLRNDALIERSERLGRILERELRAITARHPDRVAQMNGRGLFFSMHLKDPETGAPANELCDDIVLRCVRRGVLMFVTGRGFLKFTPPLVIEEDALVEGIRAVGEVVDEVEGERS